MRSRLRFAATALLLLVSGLAGIAGAATPATVPDTIEQRVAACIACHGREGATTNAGYFPRLAGKPAGYLFNQLVSFRDGRRSNSDMAYMVQHMSDAYLREIAEYFAGLDLPYPPISPLSDAKPEVLERGRVLARGARPAPKDAPAPPANGNGAAGKVAVMEKVAARPAPAAAETPASEAARPAAAPGKSAPKPAPKPAPQS